MTPTQALIDDDSQALPLGAIVLNEASLAAAATAAAGAADPAEAWLRYLRALALAGLRHWLAERQAAVVLGPELEPEAPGRLLAINGRAIQLVCASPLADEVQVPVAAWRERSTAPQALLLAEVDEDNGVVRFPGVLAGADVRGDVERLASRGREVLEVPVARFAGGVERLLRWVTLLEPSALPRGGRPDGEDLSGASWLAGLQAWLEEFLASGPELVPLPARGARGESARLLRLYCPVVELNETGEAIARIRDPNPVIWADQPVAEIVLEVNGVVAWHQLARRGEPIEGPIRWPLEPMNLTDEYTLKLRSLGGSIGQFALVRLCPCWV